MVAAGGVFVAARLADQRQGRVAGGALCRRRGVGHWSRRHLRDMRRQCGEMVSRSSGPRRRPDGGRIWCRRGRHRHSDSKDDRLDRIFGHLLLVRDWVRAQSSSCWRGCSARRSPARCQPDPLSRSCSRRPAARQARCCASPVFWLLYVMFVLVSASGLMVTAQIARDRQGLWRCADGDSVRMARR